MNGLAGGRGRQALLQAHDDEPPAQIVCAGGYCHKF
jgi:hypothetical protein